MGEHDAEAWQAAIEALLLVVEHDGPVMMARIAMMQALNGHDAKPDQEPRSRIAKAFRSVR